MNCDFNRFTGFKIRRVPEYLGLYFLSVSEGESYHFVNILYVGYSWAQRSKVPLLKSVHQGRQSPLLNLQIKYTKETNLGKDSVSLFTNGKLGHEQD